MPKQQDLDVLSCLRASQQHSPSTRRRVIRYPIRNPTGGIVPSGLSGPNAQDSALRRVSGTHKLKGVIIAPMRQVAVSGSRLVTLLLKI